MTSFLDSVPEETPIKVDNRGEKKPIVLQIQLPKDVLEQYLAGEWTEKVQLINGPRPSFCIGSKKFQCTSIPETAPHEVYRARRSNSLELVGRIQQKLMLRRELDGNAAQRLKSRTARVENEKKEKRTRIVTLRDTGMHRNGSDPFHSRRSGPSLVVAPVSNNGSNSTSSSHHQQYPSAGSNPSATHRPGNHHDGDSPGVSRVELKRRVVHLLALRPVTDEVLKNRTKASLAEIRVLLPEVATKTPVQQWELRPEMYATLRIFDWTPYTPEDRNLVVRRAKAAFDSLSLPPDAPERAVLSPGGTVNVSSPVAGSLPSSMSSASSRQNSRPSISTGGENLNNTPSSSTHKQKLPAHRASTSHPTTSSPRKQQQQQQQQQPQQPHSHSHSQHTISSDPPTQSSARRQESPHVNRDAANVHDASSDSHSAPSASSARKRKVIAETNNQSKQTPANSDASVRVKKQRNGKRPPAELYVMARRFRQAYPKYQSLYKKVLHLTEVKDAADPDLNDLQEKLLSLHKQLKNWKSTLFSASKEYS
ncbi:RNA polymerase II transcription elongation factor SpELL [Schizosaccharomyces japonicus yFS275]|uniref:RNA polymerase II transcription elongation factor SpELL n=1 Tax=Schizosaccharomyces japonicus (strain yFS275 / FY16936) TaxID=402676 RepID=B6K2C5_SCHJY|nr:RNA polymerase II transcription elongation factor SpELL [Schizosaccharomyces japonicus yFS275]EEB07306.1 RNA polymerase II transcription elongation factor SpELL [Schizosaccharomyces japonicus yFS275]